MNLIKTHQGSIPVSVLQHHIEFTKLTLENIIAQRRSDLFLQCKSTLQVKDHLIYSSE